MNQFNIGDKVVIYKQGVVEKIEHSCLGTQIHVRYKNPDKSLTGDGIAWVDQSLVEHVNHPERDFTTQTNSVEPRRS